MSEINFISEKDYKRARRREWVREKVTDAQIWCDNHRQEIAIVSTVVLPAAATITKVCGKRINLGKEKALKENYCYDRSLGHYWALKRAPSNREWLEIDRRKKNGERLADILSELKLLK